MSKSILDMIRERQVDTEKWAKEYRQRIYEQEMGTLPPKIKLRTYEDDIDPNTPIKLREFLRSLERPLNRHVVADDWQRFAKNFVSEYGGHRVHTTGMTHPEFLEYMKTGRRELDL